MAQTASHQLGCWAASQLCLQLDTIHAALSWGHAGSSRLQAANCRLQRPPTLWHMAQMQPSRGVATKNPTTASSQTAEYAYTKKYFALVANFTLGKGAAISNFCLTLEQAPAERRPPVRRLSPSVWEPEQFIAHPLLFLLLSGQSLPRKVSDGLECVNPALPQHALPFLLVNDLNPHQHPEPKLQLLSQTNWQAKLGVCRVTHKQQPSNQTCPTASVLGINALPRKE